MDKRATVRPVRASFSIEQVENGWTVSTNDGTVLSLRTRRNWWPGSAWSLGCRTNQSFRNWTPWNCRYGNWQRPTSSPRKEILLSSEQITACDGVRRRATACDG